MKRYRIISLTFAVIFGMVGAIFLVLPEQVFILFNKVSPVFGFPVSPVFGHDFYVILAVGYMYLVTLLAIFMYRHPENKTFPLLLANAKLASSLISLIFFLLHHFYLIYLANAVTDGSIGIVAGFFYWKILRDGK